MRRVGHDGVEQVVPDRAGRAGHNGRDRISIVQRVVQEVVGRDGKTTEGRV